MVSVMVRNYYMFGVNLYSSIFVYTLIIRRNGMIIFIALVLD